MSSAGFKILNVNIFTMEVHSLKAVWEVFKLLISPLFGLTSLSCFSTEMKIQAHILIYPVMNGFLCSEDYMPVSGPIRTRTPGNPAVVM